MTRSRVISSIRQVVAPSRKVWPAPRLVDHLLVELADAAAVGQVDAVEAAVGDRAGVGDDELAGAFAAVHRAARAVPDDPRAQLGEAVGGVAPVEHVEHVLELFAGELAEGLGRGDDALDLVDLPLVERRHRDQVLGEHVERVLRDHRLLDRAFAHPPRDHGALEQVGAELGKDAAAADLAQRVAGAADPLQAAADRLRRLDLDHQVDGAHVDAELQRARRDEAGKLPRLEHLLDHEALFVGERPVMRPGDLGQGLIAVGRGSCHRGGGSGLSLGSSPDGCALSLSWRGEEQDAAPVRTPPPRRHPRKERVAGVLGGRKLLGSLFLCKLVQALREALGCSARIDEDDRRVVFLD